MNDTQAATIVVGAGIVGLSTALWLQRAGIDVTVIDRGEPGGGASYGNAGTIATYACLPIATPWLLRDVPDMLMSSKSPLSIRFTYLPRLAPWLMRFARATTSRRFHAAADSLATLLGHARDAYAALLEQCRADDLVRSRGCLYIYGTESSFRGARPALDEQQARGVWLRVLDTREVAELEPAIKPRYVRGVFFERAEHIVDPAALTRRMAEAFTAAGGLIMRDEVVSVRKRDSGFEIIGREASYSAARMVIAAGAWSGPLCRQLGEPVPLDTERGYHVMFPAAGSLVSRPVCLFERGFYMTPMANGLRVVGTVELGGLRAPPTRRRIDNLVAGAHTLLDGLGEPGDTWLGFRPSLPDSLPVIGPSRRHAGLFYAFGHGHLGLTLGPLTGRLVADLATGRTPDIDLSPFRVDRF